MGRETLIYARFSYLVFQIKNYSIWWKINDVVQIYIVFPHFNFIFILHISLSTCVLKYQPDRVIRSMWMWETEVMGKRPGIQKVGTETAAINTFFQIRKKNFFKIPSYFFFLLQNFNSKPNQFINEFYLFGFSNYGSWWDIAVFSRFVIPGNRKCVSCHFSMGGGKWKHTIIFLQLN